MRFSKWLALVVLVATPYLATADDIPTIDELQASDSPAQSGVSFDPSDNTIGNPNSPHLLTNGTLQQLTFLSGGDDPLTIAANIINLSLSFLGLLSLIFILYAGYKWFVARDNEEDVTKAKDILKGAVVGLTIVLSSLGIAQLLFNSVLTATTIEQTTWMDWLIPPAYAEDPVAYEPEELPFDPFDAADSSGNVAVADGSLSSIYFVDLQVADPVTVTLAIINILLTLLAMGFLVLLIYSGVLWATARGNEETIGKAKTTLIRAVIGLIIILSAYGIANVVTWWIYVSTVV